MKKTHPHESPKTQSFGGACAKHVPGLDLACLIHTTWSSLASNSWQSSGLQACATIPGSLDLCEHVFEHVSVYMSGTHGYSAHVFVLASKRVWSQASV